jgi:uncharacterized protein (DUF924 family)
MTTDLRALELVNFWHQAGMAKWFTKDAAFDQALTERFLTLHEEAARGALRAWEDDPTGALALVILLDQFPRNAFRREARMFATDELARDIARRAIEAGHDHAVASELRMFFYLPFEHSESLADQDLSLTLHEAIGFTQYAIEHRDIIVRFGRFPHRNAVLGRRSTSEEQAFLDEGGFAG